MSQLQEILKIGLQATLVEVDDFSAEHAGHLGHNHSGSHIAVKIVSPLFEGKSQVERHRMVYAVVNEEFSKSLHALKIEALAPNEYLSRAN
jgi:BolA protein